MTNGEAGYRPPPPRIILNQEPPPVGEPFPNRQRPPDRFDDGEWEHFASHDDGEVLTGELQEAAIRLALAHEGLRDLGDSDWRVFGCGMCGETREDETPAVAGCHGGGCAAGPSRGNTLWSQT